MRKLIGFSVLMALASCSTGPSLQSRMASFIGAPAETLVQKLGVPNRQVTINNNQYYAYDDYHTQIEPGFGAYGFYGAPPFGGPFYGGPFIDAGIPPRISQSGCETTFLLQNNKVVSFTLRGDDCR